MKIDKKHYPALWYHEYSFNEDVKTILRHANKNVCFLCQTILDNIDAQKSKLFQLRNEVQENTRTVLVKRATGYASMSYSIFHDSENKNKTNIVVTTCSDTLATTLIGGYFKKDEEGLHAYVKNENDEKEFEYNHTGIYYALVIELFLQYAEIETKIIKPGHKQTEGVKTLYQNKSKSNVTIIDSTWFTNLVVSGAFKVRGFFRLQPYGKRSEGKRRLKWINEFVKHGYVRKAKKLQEDEKQTPHH